MVRRIKDFDIASDPFGQRDHSDCMETALRKAEEICNREGARFTDSRREVFQAIWQSQCPIGAYDILEEISKKKGKKAPPTIYRAIYFLLEQGLIHRLESLNAFIACPHPEDRHTGIFLICADCGKSAELHNETLIDSLQKTARDASFEALQGIVEVKGRCVDCREGLAH